MVPEDNIYGLSAGMWTTMDPLTMAENYGFTVMEVKKMLATGFEVTTDTEILETYDGVYRISDEILSADQLVGMPMTITLTDGTVIEGTLTEDDINYEYPMVTISGLFGVSYADITDEDGSIGHGIYLIGATPSDLATEGIASVVIGTI